MFSAHATGKHACGSLILGGWGSRADTRGTSAAETARLQSWLNINEDGGGSSVAALEQASGLGVTLSRFPLSVPGCGLREGGGCYSPAMNEWGLRRGSPGRVTFFYQNGLHGAGGGHLIHPITILVPP